MAVLDTAIFFFVAMTGSSPVMMRKRIGFPLK
jgi:uncharacterized PurR-regulated membrane protein YhhQ (DUF165 family)